MNKRQDVNHTELKLKSHAENDHHSLENQEAARDEKKVESKITDEK